MSNEPEREFVGNGRYAIDRLLGSGGSGTVNLAYDTKLERWVAIKRMPAGDNSALREASIIANLHHPNIVMIHDIIEQGVEVFFVMELVLGPTLEDLVEAMSEGTFRDFATQCLLGLAAAHEKNVVHRDVKAGNIMLAPLAEGGYRVKILDFGQSRVSEEPSLQTIDHNGAVVGSIYAMSPEQLGNEPLDLRTDLYSLGCVFYQALTLERPFKGGSVTEVYASHFRHRFNPLGSLRPDLPVALTMWVEQLFSLERSDRPSSSLEALAMLHQSAGAAVIRAASPLEKTMPVLKHTQAIILPAVPLALNPHRVPKAKTPPLPITQAISKMAPQVLAAPPTESSSEDAAPLSDEAESIDPAFSSPPLERYVPPPDEPQSLPRKLWKKLTERRFLFISVIVHVLIGIIAMIFVVQSIVAKRKLTFTSAPPSPNKSQRALEHKVTMAKKQNTMSAPAQAKRITTTGLSKVSLPDMPAISTSTDFNAGKMAGMGGTGVGLGFKGGMATTGGKASLGGPISFFGMRGKNENVLHAKFYDLKQTNDKKPYPMEVGNFFGTITKFIKDNNWSLSTLSKYYCAPAPLFAPRLYVPLGLSVEAPKAFGVEKEATPGFWLVHYKGRFRALKKGAFRFVGAADNVLVVRLNKKNVLASAHTIGNSLDPSANSNPPEKLGSACGGYRFKGQSWQLDAGKWFDVSNGQTFDIEILIGDDQGGSFAAYLFYEEKGAIYPKRPDGSAFVYPVFELDGSPMPPVTFNNSNPPIHATSEKVFEGMKPGL